VIHLQLRDWRRHGYSRDAFCSLSFLQNNGTRLGHLSSTSFTSTMIGFSELYNWDGSYSRRLEQQNLNRVSTLTRSLSQDTVSAEASGPVDASCKDLQTEDMSFTHDEATARVRAPLPDRDCLLRFLRQSTRMALASHPPGSVSLPGTLVAILLTPA
jgi:hypothetical protein